MRPKQPCAIILSTTLWLAAAASRGSAQDRTGSENQRAAVTVTVTDSAKAPLEDAQVVVGTAVWKTGSDGKVIIGNQGRDTLEGVVRRVGYGNATFKARTGEQLTVVLQKLQLIRDVVVRGSPPMTQAKRSRLEGFFRRRAEGEGTFIDREAIDARDAERVVDLLRSVSGIRIRYIGSIPYVQFVRCAQVEVYINGIRASQGFSDLFAIQPKDLEALEIYHGLATVPAEFSPRPNDCAAVAVWTR